MTFGGRGIWSKMGSVERQNAAQMVNICLAAGINFFDTADIYSDGLAEEILRQALGTHRSSVILATKVRGRMGLGPNDVGLSRKYIIEAVEASLRRLGTDWIDLYQIHNWDTDTPLEETMSALDHLVQSGKVRYIGCSNLTGWQLAKAQMLAELRGWSGFITLQALYNIIHRDLEQELMPLCEEDKIGILPWSPLAGGFLTGKYRKGKPRPRYSRLTDRDKTFLEFNEERGFKIVEKLDKLSSAHNGTVSQGAINWLRAKSNISSIIIGARTFDQLEENIKCLEWQFNSEEIAALDEVSAIELRYPYFMQAQWTND